MTAAQGQTEEPSSFRKLLVIPLEGMEESFGGPHTGGNAQHGTDSSFCFSHIKPGHRAPSSHRRYACGVLCLFSLQPFSFSHRLPLCLLAFQHSSRPVLYLFEAFPDCFGGHEFS